jgi:hypothetical protein
MPAQPISRSAGLGQEQRRGSPAVPLLLAAGVLLIGWVALGGPLRSARSALALAPQVGPIRVVKIANPTFFIGSGGQVEFTVRVENLGSTLGFTIDTLVDSPHGNLNGQGNCTVPQTVPPLGSYECSFAATVSGSAGYAETDVVIATGLDDNQTPVNGSASATVRILAPTTPTPTATFTLCSADGYEIDDSRVSRSPAPGGVAQLHGSVSVGRGLMSIEPLEVGRRTMLY